MARQKLPWFQDKNYQNCHGVKVKLTTFPETNPANHITKNS